MSGNGGSSLSAEVARPQYFSSSPHKILWLLQNKIVFILLIIASVLGYCPSSYTILFKLINALQPLLSTVLTSDQVLHLNTAMLKYYTRHNFDPPLLWFRPRSSPNDGIDTCDVIAGRGSNPRVGRLVSQDMNF